jgi:pSer/pThr/pTyr-binding forkhead associated (FHA) protein
VITEVDRLQAPSPPAKAHVLQLTAGPGAPREFVVVKSETVVGRARKADISISCETLSREHARLTLDGGEMTCLDLDSRNGVVLNGVRVQSAVLRPGDVLQLGDIVLTYWERFA